MLSSGCADDLLLPNDEPSHSCTLEGLDTSQGEDLVQLSLTLNVPAGASSVSFDWKFYSEEFPEFVGSIFNDAFLVEAGASNYVLSGATITAPDNVAFDQNGDLISVNTSGFLAMTSAEASGTTYDAATPKLNTVAPVPSGASTVTLVFSIFDMGDSIYDSTVLLDNVKFDASPITGPSTKKAADLTGEVPATATANSRISVSAKLIDATTSSPIANATIKWSMSPAGPTPSSVTNAGGNTTAQLDLAGLAPGAYVVKATFEGNSEYQMESFEKPLQITGPGPTPNNPPNAVDDSAQTSLNTAVTIDPLANDSDPDGDNLVILSTTNPANGTAVKSSDGKTVFYLPASGFNGTDNFDYTIWDGRGGNDTARISVVVNATTPTPPPEEKNMFCGRDADDFDNVVMGTNADETIWGTEKDDLIRGWGGNDTIYGVAGNDCLKGDDGNDHLGGGGAGMDMIMGDASDDRMWGGTEDDVLFAGAGHDMVVGDNGNDKLYSEEGDDRLYDAEGDDYHDGGPDTDKCHDSVGANTVVNCEEP